MLEKQNASGSAAGNSQEERKYDSRAGNLGA